jgi:hypothetical protein
MPKVPSELKGLGVAKDQLNPYTGQLSRWSGRLNAPALRAAGRTAGGIIAGGISTGLTVLEGFYDLTVEVRALIHATSSDECGCKE